MTAASPAPRPTRVAFALWLDVGLFVAYLLVHTPRSTGVFGHEALGVALAIPLLVHLLLSWRWIASKVTRALAPGALRTRVNVLINAVLFASMVVVIVSGVVVSRELLPSVGLPTVFDRAWFRLHVWSGVGLSAM